MTLGGFSKRSNFPLKRTQQFPLVKGSFLRKSEAEYTINGSEKYIRVECFDVNGKTAWSNPIVFQE